MLVFEIWVATKISLNIVLESFSSKLVYKRWLSRKHLGTPICAVSNYRLFIITCNFFTWLFLRYFVWLWCWIPIAKIAKIQLVSITMLSTVKKLFYCRYERTVHYCSYIVLYSYHNQAFTRRIHDVIFVTSYSFPDACANFMNSRSFTID